MKRSHVEACEEIVAASDPWKRLGERVDFLSVLSRNSTNTQAYVCTVGTETAGFILFIPEPVFARGGYLRAIGVSPRFRRKGIGGKLLSFAERMTAKRALHFFLCASSFNRRAQTFYKNCGYTHVGKLPGFIKLGLSEYIYWKRLRPRR
jgi:ribosomal protein S18 acetylase RimI-like enzyme